MNPADFIAKALSIARDYKTSYIWGGLGSPITDASLTRAANAYAKNTERGGLTPLAATPETPRRFISIAWASLRRSCGGGAGIAPEPTAAPPIRP